MLDDPPQMAARRVPLAVAQVSDLLDQVREIERKVRPAGGQPAQRLVPRPGVEVLLVQLLGPDRHVALLAPALLEHGDAIGTAPR
jgi:hypothetical protein